MAGLRNAALRVSDVGSAANDLPGLLDGPFDLGSYLKQVPEGATCTGMFLQRVVNIANATHRPTPVWRRYHAFQNYDVREQMTVLKQCAAAIHPRLPMREALRRVGRLAYPSFAESLLGHLVLDKVSTEGFEALLALTPRAYRLSSNFGSARVIPGGEGCATIIIRDRPDFADCMHIGFFEGAMEYHGIAGRVLAHAHRGGDVDLLLEWGSAEAPACQDPEGRCDNASSPALPQAR